MCPPSLGTVSYTYKYEGSAQYVYCLERTICLSECESPRSQLFYSQIYKSQPTFLVSLMKRNQNGWLGWIFVGLYSVSRCCPLVWPFIAIGRIFGYLPPVLSTPMFPCGGLAFQGSYFLQTLSLSGALLRFFFSEQFIFWSHFTDILVDALWFIQGTGLTKHFSL